MSCVTNFLWPYIFFVKTPLLLFAAILCWKLLQQFETKTVRSKIDKVGLALLVGMGNGFCRCWMKVKSVTGFESNRIVIWRSFRCHRFCRLLNLGTDRRDPVVDLKVFRHRGYSHEYADFVSRPLVRSSVSRLLHRCGYKSIWVTPPRSGYATAQWGLAVFLAPIIVICHLNLTRPFVFVGVIWLGLWTFCVGLAVWI